MLPKVRKVHKPSYSLDEQYELDSIFLVSIGRESKESLLDTSSLLRIDNTLIEVSC